MLINKDGKIIANASQPTVIFNTKAEYQAWEDTLPKQGSTEEEKKAFLEKMLSRFVIIKKYETIEDKGLVIFCTTENDMKGTGSETHKKIDGAVYVVKENNKLYRYENTGTETAPIDKWTLIGGVGGVKYVAALPTPATAEDGVLYILKDTLSKYIVKSDKSGFDNVGNEVALMDDFTASAHQTVDATAGTTTADREAGSVVIDSKNGKSYVSLGKVTSTTKDAWYCFASVNNSAEFYANVGSFPNTSAATFPKLSALPTGYKVEDRFFVARDTMSMYVIEEVADPSPATTTHYEYSQISQVLDNVEIHDYKDATTAPGSYTGNDFFPAVGSVDIIYVAKLEGILYIWDNGAYVPVGGADEVQVYPSFSAFPPLTKAQEGKLYVALDEAQCYVIGEGAGTPLYVASLGENYASVKAKYLAGDIAENTYCIIPFDAAATVYGAFYTTGGGLSQKSMPAGEGIQLIPSGSDVPETAGSGKGYYDVANNKLYMNTAISGTGPVTLVAPIGGKQYVLVSQRPTVIYNNKAAFPAVGTDNLIYIAKDTGKMYYYDKAAIGDDKYIKLGDCEDVVVAEKAIIESMALQQSILYVASDEKKCYVALPKAGVTPETLELVQVGGGDIPPMTQAQWDAAKTAGTAPDLAFITDSIFDATGFQP